MGNYKHGASDRLDTERVFNMRSSQNLYVKVLAVIMCVVMAFVMSVSPVGAGRASADTMDDIVAAEQKLDALVEKVEAAQDLYNGAQDKYDAAQKQIEANQKRIDEIEAQLEGPRAELGDILSWQYKNNAESIINVLAGASSIDQVLRDYEYLSSIQDQKAAVIKAIAKGEEELLLENEKLQQEQRAAEDAQREQQEIMDAAQPDIDELNNYINSLRDDLKEELVYKGQHGGGPAFEAPEGASVVDYAASRTGCPYIWAASGPTSFDCSGLVIWCYSQARGMSLPHNSESLKAAAKQIVPVSEAQPGDVLYRPGHVGICSKPSGEEYIHAPHSGAFVRYQTGGSWSCALRF